METCEYLLGSKVALNTLVTNQERAHRILTWLQYTRKHMRVTHLRNHKGLHKTIEYLRDCSNGLDWEQAFWLHRLIGGASDFGFQSLVASPLQFPLDWNSHMEHPQEEWWFACHMFHPACQDVFLHWHLERRQYAPKDKLDVKDNDPVLLKLRITLYFSRTEQVLSLKPVTISLGASIVEHERMNWVLGQQRMQSEFPQTLFPLRLDIGDIEQRISLNVEVKSMTEYTQFGTQKHGMGTKGYLYPLCDFQGHLTWNGQDYNNIQGLGSHGHTWSYGWRNPATPTDFVKQSLKLLQMARHSVASNRYNLRIHMWLNNDIQIIGQTLLPSNTTDIIFQTLRISDSNGTVYSDSPSAFLQYDTHTIRFIHRKFECNLTLTANPFKTSSADYPGVDMCHQIWMGSVDGRYHSAQAWGHGVCWVECPLVSPSEVANILKILPVTDSPHDITNERVSPGQVTASVLFWILPGVLFILLVVMTALLLKQSRVFAP